MVSMDWQNRDSSTLVSRQNITKIMLKYIKNNPKKAMRAYECWKSEKSVSYKPMFLV
jgi:hypothetical protein